MTQVRRRVKHTLTFEERLTEEARRFRAEAERLPPGSKRDVLLMRVRQTEAALHMTKWLQSPGLQPPRQMTEIKAKYSAQ
jgi:hypothetical protein